MLEKMKSVSNPLTIIGLFCGVVEVVGLIVMGTGNISPEAQRDLIWLVKWFPVLLVSLFFITLWFKDRVLYAPGDFKDEKNYLDLVRANAKRTIDIEIVQAMIAEAKTDITSEVMKTIPTNGAGDRNKVEEIVNEKLRPVQDAVEDVKSEATWNYVKAIASVGVDNSLKTASTRVWTILNGAGKPLTVAEIAAESKMSVTATRRAISSLTLADLVDVARDESGALKFVAIVPSSKAQ